MRLCDVGEAILRAVIEEPDTDFHRLAYADWLDDQGEHARAEFIRVQLELDGLDEMKSGCVCGFKGTCRLCRYERLAGRERQLLTGLFYEPPPGYTAPGNRVHGRYAWAGMPLASFHDPDHKGWDFARGFVSTVRLSLDLALQHLPTLVARHPITRVELADFVIGRPRPASTQSLPARIFVNNTDGVQQAEATYIPECVGKKLTRGRFMRVYLDREYETDAELMDDLSDACIVWARRRATR